MKLLTKNALESVLNKLNNDLRNQRDAFLFLQEAARELNTGILKGTSLWARYQGPHIILGTGDFQGRSWHVPANVTVVPRTETSNRGRPGTGRGFSLASAGEQQVEFFTGYDECFLDEDRTDVGFIAEQMADQIHKALGAETETAA